MSTIVRSNSDSLSGRGGRGGRADRGGHADRGGRADRSARDSQARLTGRALRVRNACVCRAAAQMGLAMPSDAELLDIPNGASLREAVDWWKARAPGAVELAESGAGVSLMMRTAVAVAVTLVGLAFSYGQAQ